MHRPQFFTWTTHTAETTLLEATRLQKLYTYMCNIVTEFYLYNIVYIYFTLPSLAGVAALKSLITLYINICKITFFPSTQFAYIYAIIFICKLC